MENSQITVAVLFLELSLVNFLKKITPIHWKFCLHIYYLPINKRNTIEYKSTTDFVCIQIPHISKQLTIKYSIVEVSVEIGRH